MYTIKNQKVLKNGTENVNIPSFKRGDHVESKYPIMNEFYPFQNTKKGRQTEN